MARRDCQIRIGETGLRVDSYRASKHVGFAAANQPLQQTGPVCRFPWYTVLAAGHAAELCRWASRRPLDGHTRACHPPRGLSVDVLDLGVGGLEGYLDD